MVSQLDSALQWAHRANIDRYRRLLETPLTHNEREFIERRLDEEQQALLEIVDKNPDGDCSMPDRSDPQSGIADEGSR